MKNTILNNLNFRLIRNSDLLKIKKLSDQSDLQRARINLHKNYKSKIQDMVICFKKNSYVDPHYFKNKNTIFKLIKGSILINIYESNGYILEKIKLNKSNPFLFIVKGTIYDVRGIANYTYVHEFMEGPFKKELFRKLTKKFINMKNNS